jgi:DNA modification methylase
VARRPSHLEIDDQRVFFATSEDLGFLRRESVDLVMTSPPYWNLKDYGHAGQIGASAYEEYLDRLDRVWAECYRVSRPRAVMVLNVGSRRHRKRFYPIAFHVAERMRGWTLWDVLIWYVPNALPQPSHYVERLFDNKFEFLLIFTKGDRNDYTFHKPRVPQKYRLADPRVHKKNARGRCLGNVIRVPAYRPPNVKELGYHVAAYPEELVGLVVESFTDPGDVVLDPFVGSGTTLKVTRAMGRRGIGVELNSRYRSLIERRILEPWQAPDWRELDILHASTMTPGASRSGARRRDTGRKRGAEGKRRRSPAGPAAASRRP